jgi:hypothetical protein
MSNNKRVVVYSSEHVEAVRAAAGKAGRVPLFVSPPGAGLSHGYPWFLNLIGQEAEGLLDCADAPGAVLAALRQGAKYLRVRAEAEAFARLCDIAAQYGARLEVPGEIPELNLLDIFNPRVRCDEWFDPEA